MTDESAEEAGSANVPITYPPCSKCGIPMRLGFIEPLDESRHERRLYECIPCKKSVAVVVALP
jgi:hypothetical protein